MRTVFESTASRIRPFFLCAAALLSLALATPALATEIKVKALFKNKAMLDINGKTSMVAVGETPAEGVRLVEANSNRALIEVNGVIESYQVGSDVHTNFTARKTTEVRISRDPGGMFRTVGSINGINVNFLVDTGASMVALNEPTANQLGIPYRIEGREGIVHTASGRARAWYIMLDRVRVGGIELHNIRAAVVEGDTDNEVLLGMSFLNQLQMTNSSQLLVLTKNW